MKVERSKIKTTDEILNYLKNNPFDCMITEIDGEERTIYHQNDTEIPSNVKDLANNKDMTPEEILSVLSSSGIKTTLVIIGKNKFLLIHKDV